MINFSEQNQTIKINFVYFEWQKNAHEWTYLRQIAKHS